MVYYDDNSKLHALILTKLGLYFVGKGNDHLQLIKFWPSHAPGKGSVVGQKILAPPYYSHRTVFASPPSAFFIDAANDDGDCGIANQN